ncbi:MAG: RsiV family protein [Planctomycetota bacterium]
MVVTRVWCGAAVRLLAGAFVVVTTAAAQRSAWPESGSHVYRGAIALDKGQLAVQMSLRLPKVVEHGEVPAVSGEYRYEKRGRGLRLVGDAIGERGELELREHERTDDGSDGAATGRWVGKLDAGARHFTGTWHAADGRTTHRFALELVAVERTITSEQPFGPKREQQVLVLLAKHPLASAVNAAMQQSLLEFAAAPVAVDDEPTWQEFRDVQDGNVSRTPASLHTDEGVSRWMAYHVGDELVSLAGLGWEYAGGAHGNSWPVCMNFVLRDGVATPLRLADLAVDERSGPQLFELLRDKLRELGASGADQLTAEPLDGDRVPPFVVSPAGVVFGFGPYAVGSYAEGHYHAQLTWAELRGVLTPPRQLGLTPAKSAVDAAARGGR